MKKAFVWIVVVVAGLLGFFWVDDGIYIGSESVPQVGILKGKTIEHSILTCRYLTFTGIDTRFGWPAGTDPAMLLPDLTKPFVAETGCRISYPWDVFRGDL